MTSNKNNTFILILGMHRSGTSCLAGCLERCGLFLGDVSHSGRFNAKGNHELKSIHQLHDQILALNKGFWYDPPELIMVHPHHKLTLTEIAVELAKQPICGVKDPRLLLLMEFWLEIITPLTQKPVFVGTFRHPQAVSISLQKRDGISNEEALQLWIKYNSRLVRQHQKQPFPIIEYDLSDRSRYLNAIGELVGYFGLTKKPFQLRSFVSKKLDHYLEADLTVPPECQEIYNYLYKNSFQS